MITKGVGTETTYANTIPSIVIFHGRRYRVSDWSDVMVVICDEIIDDTPYLMDRLVDSPINSLGENQPLFSYDWKEIRLPRKRLSNGLYVKSGLEAEKSVDICYKIIELCGYKSDDLKIIFSKKDIESEDSNKIDEELSLEINQSDDLSIDNDEVIDNYEPINNDEPIKNDEPINNIDEEYFDDPAKLLKWLDKTN